MQQRQDSSNENQHLLTIELSDWMNIFLRQASSNENQHLLTLELSDWMEYRKKLHYHRRLRFANQYDASIPESMGQSGTVVPMKLDAVSKDSYS